MPQVKLNIAGREYQVNCADGEEQRLEALGGLIDDKLREGAEPSALSETRALLYAALFLADEVHDLRRQPAHSDDERSAVALENLAGQIEGLASRLENAAPDA